LYTGPLAIRPHGLKNRRPRSHRFLPRMPILDLGTAA
jgi:hypothetical protein